MRGCEEFDFCFGGRRQFCKSDYADLGELVVLQAVDSCCAASNASRLAGYLHICTFIIHYLTPGHGSCGMSDSHLSSG